MQDVAKRCGVDELRPFQVEAVDALVRGDDVFLGVATGGGKTMVYQAAAVALGGTVLVVTPLLSLMQDQLEDCESRGLPAAKLTVGGMTPHDGPRLLFTCPESAACDPGLWGGGPLAIAVDEAHCVTEHGLGFRPDYARLGCLREAFPAVPIVAATASVTGPVYREICRILKLDEPTQILGPMVRANLQFSVRRVADVAEARVEAARLAVAAGKSLIYSRTKAGCDALTETLRRQGVDAAAYHADLPGDERARVLDRFREAAAMVVVATTAFGMGVNIRDIRAVVNLGTPFTAMELYQQAGRAGRDGAPSACCLVTYRGDMHGGTDAMALEGVTDAAARARAIAGVRSMREYLALSGGQCRQQFLTRDFVASAPPEPCRVCDLCVAGGPAAATTSARAVDQTLVPLIVELVGRAGRFGKTNIIDALVGRKTPRSKALLAHRPADWPRDRQAWTRAFDEAVDRGLLAPHHLTLRKGLHAVVYGVG